MNTYEQFLVEKVWKKCNWCQEKQKKGVFLAGNRECFALSHFIFTNQKYIFVSASSTVKVVNVANYDITI